MKKGDRLKLLRTLNWLSQEEMAAMIGISRGLYAQIETDKDKTRNLVAERAEFLSKILHVDSHWLLGEHRQMLGSTRFALFIFDGSKTVAATQATQVRALNSAVTTVKDLLPQVFYEKLQYCYEGITADGTGALFFFVIEGQGIMVKIINSKDMVLAVKDVALKLNVGTINEAQLSADKILTVDYANPELLAQFIREMNIDDICKEDFALTVLEPSGIQADSWRKTKRGNLTPATPEEARSNYVQSIYMKQVERIAADIEEHGLKLEDIEVAIIAKREKKEAEERKKLTP